MKNQSISKNLDWISVAIYSALVIMGWLNIYSSSYIGTDGTYQKQALFIVCSTPIIIAIFALDSKFYEKFTIPIFAITIISLLGLFVFGKTIHDQRCWYAIGNFTLQPSEFAKTGVALALAKYLSSANINLAEVKYQIRAFAILAIPVLLILPQPDPGSAMIYFVLIMVLYREGLPVSYLWVIFFIVLFFVLTLQLDNVWIVASLGLLLIVFLYFKARKVKRSLIFSTLLLSIIVGFVFSVNYVFYNVFKQHHRDRFNILLGKTQDLQGIGYNTDQSKIAIGSGGWFGKGFLEGTQTKGGFVPEQHTDYIFTTVGEEWGFLGSLVVIGLFTWLFLRIIYLAEIQKTKFSRIYGYCVASFLFFHFFVNIAMVIGLFPTIGVPLPFFSYGGSGLWGFTILLFIFLRMDANKANEW
jgi:rod shape determining protein RodA